MNRIVTVTQVLAWHSCYSPERVEQLFNGRDALTAFDVLDLVIPHEDRIWAVCHAGSYVH